MLNEVVKKYVKLFPQDKPKLSGLLKQINNSQSLNNRHNYQGHVTGSAIIFSPKHFKILLIYHPMFDRWQQPGGHWDLEEGGPWLAAEREAIEETGVKIAKKIHPTDDYRVPLAIDSHLVPANPLKTEPKHYHHDFRYGFVAESEKIELKDAVIEEAKWFKLDEAEAEIMRIEIKRMVSLLQNLKA
jgi:8-oxo-dGTP pyrophosphatase MutT (NUDIX family)